MEGRSRSCNVRMKEFQKEQKEEVEESFLHSQDTTNM